MDKIKKICSNLNEYFWLFVIGSIIGCFYEMILEFFRNGNIYLHKGLIYGPFCQVYGIGLVVMVILFKKVKNKTVLFVGGFISGGILEYLLSYIQEIVFHSKSWDYSNYPINFSGRTSFFHMFFWGIFVLLIMNYLYPFLHKKLEIFKTHYGKIITCICFVLMLLDIIISIVAAIRYYDRRMNVSTLGNIDAFLDAKYPDDRIESIYRMSVQLD